MITSFREALRRYALGAALRAQITWKWFRSRPLWQQGVMTLILLALLVGASMLLRGGAGATAGTPPRTVAVASVASLVGGGSSVSVIGTVRSVTEADVLAQTGGTVRRVHTSVGAAVPAGFVLAELDNASESAAVLQAQGAYEGAVAARNITSLQSGNTATAYVEAQAAAREAYRSAYTTIDTTLTTYVDAFFGDPTATGPQLLINPGPTANLSPRRAQITTRMNDWRRSLETADTTEPATLLANATQDAQLISTFLNDLSRAANERNSNATATQLAGLATARASVNAQLATLSAARDTLNAKKTAAQVGLQQSNGTGIANASADATVKQALGSLRAAQAAYERTVVRAPIAGTVNFLPVRVGDYVTSFMHVATVAQNGALEIVSYVSGDDRQNLAVGTKVAIEGEYEGVITSIAPALDPTTKQIEVHVAVTGTTALLDGQSVRISFPDAVRAPEVQAAGPILLPLAAVKLQANERIIFTVDDSGRLVAHAVEIGDVRGDRIEITSGLTPDLLIVTDARGLSEGQKVSVATAPTPL